MGLLIKFLFGFVFALTLSAGFVYAIYRAITELQKRFPKDMIGDRAQISDGDQLEKAQEIAARVRRSIERNRQEGCLLADDFDREVKTILDERLPKIIENRNRLGDYLKRLDLDAIGREAKVIEDKLGKCADKELAEVLKKNLRLARERERNLLQLQNLEKKTEAQIEMVILSLKNLEDKVETLHLVEDSNDSINNALDSVRDEVDVLEAEYRKMDEK